MVAVKLGSFAALFGRPETCFSVGVTAATVRTSKQFPRRPREIGSFPCRVLSRPNPHREGDAVILRPVERERFPKSYLAEVDVLAEGLELADVEPVAGAILDVDEG